MRERTTVIGLLAFYHHFCQAIPHPLGAAEAVALLQRHEAFFTQGGKSVTAIKALPNLQSLESGNVGPNYTFEPGAVISEDGGVAGLLQLHHRLLMPDVLTISARRSGSVSHDCQAFGSFIFDAQTTTVGIQQDAENVEADPISTGLLALALRFYICVHPRYGWVDESGWNLPEGKALAALKPKYLFWANFFGPEYVNAIGRDFLLNTPRGEIVDLDDGGMLYVASESYQDWWANDQADLLAYFRKKFPKIQIYRAQPSPY